MKQRKMILAVLIVQLVIAPITVQAAILSFSTPSPAASQSWIKQGLLGDEGDVTNLSTGFVGKNQVPILIYAKLGKNKLYCAYHETPSKPGNCGVDNSWYCEEEYFPLGLNSTSLSQLALYNLYSNPYTPYDKNVMGYVYESDNLIYTVRNFYCDDMSQPGGGYWPIIQLNKFGKLVGEPSFQYDMNGHETATITVVGEGIYELIYMRYTGINNTTCIDESSPYQCDVIDSSLSVMGPPSLWVSQSGSFPAIAYTKAGALYYAHPDIYSGEANCGPGGNTWRCKFIRNFGADSVVIDGVDLEIYESVQVAFLEDNTDISETRLNLANYVGSGGNCGEDNDWDCQEIQTLGSDDRDYDFSLQIEQNEWNYPVIAFSYLDSLLKLSLAYPKERLGETIGNCDNTDWVCQEIAGGLLSSNGEETSLSLNSSGLGFIGYLERISFLMRTNLMIAFQEEWKIYLPLLAR